MKNPFDRCSRDYERFRPGYPAALHDRLVSSCELDAGSYVLDVGAGPGNGAIPLIERGMAVIAAEPSLPMIRQGLESCGSLRYVCSAAEELPFAGGVFRLVTSAQSFHWFDPPRALAEFDRVLEPGGFLAVFWNTRDASCAQARLFEDLAEKFNPAHRRDYRRKDWGSIIEASHRFRVVRREEFAFTLPMDVEDWIGLARSISYIRAIGDRLPQFEQELQAGITRLAVAECPYVTSLWLAQKTDSRRAEH